MSLLRLPHVALWAAALALAVRLATVLVLGTWHLPAEADHFEFGFEMGRIARSIVEGKGYVSPFGTGEPTANKQPVYTFLLAGVFWVLGVYSGASALAILFFQSVVGAVTVLVLHALARRWVGQRAAAVAAFGFAIYPPAVYFSAGVVSPSALGVLFAAGSLLLAEILRQQGDPGIALGGGFAAGLTALVDPVYLVLLPCILFAVMRRSAALVIRLRLVIFVLVGATVALLPWTARNHIVFGDWIPVKSNFGRQLWVGNNDHATGTRRAERWGPLLDDLTPEDKALVRRMREPELDRWYLARALEWTRAHPRRVLELSLRRAGMFWWQTDFRAARDVATQIGGHVARAALSISYPTVFLLGIAGLLLAFRHHRPIGVVLLFFLLYPLVFYVTHVSTYRYRYPVEPFLVIFAAGAVTSVTSLKRLRPMGSKSSSRQDASRSHLSSNHRVHSCSEMSGPPARLRNSSDGSVCRDETPRSWRFVLTETRGRVEHTRLL